MPNFSPVLPVSCFDVHEIYLLKLLFPVCLRHKKLKEFMVLMLK